MYIIVFRAVAEIQKSHGSDTVNFWVALLTLFEMPLQKSKKSTFFGFSKNNVKRILELL